MTRTALIFFVPLVAAGLVLGTQPEPELPPGHPPTSQPAEPAIAIPPADPADVGSIDAILDSYYSSISGSKGEPRDWDRVRSLFKPMSRMIAARPTPEGGAGLWALKVEDFIEFNQKYFESGGYIESEVARRVESFGNIAHVWSTYEARRGIDDPQPYSRGVYSIQLLKDGDRWWIVNMYWDFERPGLPIPDEFLLNTP